MGKKSKDLNNIISLKTFEGLQFKNAYPPPPPVQNLFWLGNLNLHLKIKCDPFACKDYIFYYYNYMNNIYNS